MKASATKIGILVMVLIALAAGCAKKEQSSGPSRQAFNHKTHVQGAGLDCAMCHETAATGAPAGMPTLETCNGCHSEDPAKTTPFMQNGKPAWSTFAGVSDEVKFSHQAHVAKGLKCEDCHGKMAESTATGKQLAFNMDTCTNCHAQRKASQECQTCHTKLGRETEPASHELNWKKYHGQAARAQVAGTENNCSLCHNDDTCANCHRVEEPQSHTNSWRIRTHGVAARMDRSTCATCHQSDTCERCHAETVPQTHKAGWGEPRDNHCYVCHFSDQNQSCFVCHKEMTGHLEAPPLPGTPAHVGASEFGCRTCHGVGQANQISHPITNDACRTCHK